MIVCELITALKKMPSDAEVVIEDVDCEHFDVDGIREGYENTVIIDGLR